MRNCGMSMRSRTIGCLTFLTLAACGSAAGPVRVAPVPRNASCPPIGVETDTAGVVGRYYTQGRVTTKAALVRETYRQALAPGLEYTTLRGPKYPGVNGEALVAFVVDTSGRADLDTFTVDKSHGSGIDIMSTHLPIVILRATLGDSRRNRFSFGRRSSGRGARARERAPLVSVSAARRSDSRSVP